MQSRNPVHITSAEWRWVNVVSVLLVLLAFLPFLWILLIGLADSEWQFMGAIHDHYNSAAHLARVYQGTEDLWLTRFLYTPEDQSGTFIAFIYTTLGQLSRLINLSPVAVFHAARVGASLFMYVALYQLGATIWTRVRTRRIFFLVVALGSGFGWLIGPLFGRVEAPDLDMPQAFPFYSTLANVHFPLTLACLALLASVAVMIFRPGEMPPPSVENGGVIVFVGSLALMLIYPVAFLPILFAFALCVLIISQRIPRLIASSLRWLLWLTVPALPMLAYYIALTLYNDIAGDIWQRSIQAEPVFLPVFLLGFGLPLVVALPGIFRALRRFEPDGDQFMLLWMGIILVGIYVPFGPGNQLIAGLMIPIAYFATRSIEDFWFGLILNRRTRMRLLASLLPVIAISNIFMLVGPVLPVSDGNFSRASGILLQRDYLETFRWLEFNTQSDDVILAAPDVSIWLPVWSGARVVYGHPVETINADQKEQAVLDWYRGDITETECAQLLEGKVSVDNTYDVTYVLLGPQERQLGQSNCLELLTPVRRIARIQIYSYDPTTIRNNTGTND